MLLKTINLNGVNKIVQITDMTFDEYLVSNVKADEKELRAALKKSGYNNASIESELDKLKKSYLKLCREHNLNSKE